MNKPCCRRSRAAFYAAGMSLIEMLIALLLSSILLIALIGFFVEYKKNFQKNQQLLHTQENMRFVSYVLRHNLANAGYAGCRTLSDAIKVYHTGSANMPAFVQGRALTGNDVLVIKKADLDVGFVQGLQQPSKLIVSYQPAYESGDQVLLSDCLHQEVFTINKVSRSKKNNQQILTVNKPIQYQYKEHAQLGLYQEIAFYLAKNSRGQSALYWRQTGKNAQELAEGVSSMQLAESSKVFLLSLSFVSQKKLAIAFG